MKAEKLVNKILAALDAIGWNQVDLEREAGLPKNKISKWKGDEKGGEPTARQALAIARAIKVPLDWLCDDTQDYPPPPAVVTSPTRSEVIALAERAARILGEDEVIRRLLTSPSVERPQPQARIVGNAVLTDRPQKAPSEGFQRQHESSERPD
jgi:transcriptional regulator with XRE-family HTH domain